MDAFAPPPGAVIEPRCRACGEKLGERVWLALIRCRRCETLALVQAGQGVRTVGEGVALAA